MIERVLGRLPRSTPAALPDHERRCMRGATYPGLVARPGARVEGLLYHGLDPGALARLDAFEGDREYERVELPVDTASGPLSAQVYRVPDRLEHLLADAAWDPARFERLHLAAFLRAGR